MATFRLQVCICLALVLIATCIEKTEQKPFISSVMSTIQSAGKVAVRGASRAAKFGTTRLAFRHGAHGTFVRTSNGLKRVIRVNKPKVNLNPKGTSGKFAKHKTTKTTTTGKATEKQLADVKPTNTQKVNTQHKGNIKSESKVGSSKDTSTANKDQPTSLLGNDKVPSSSSGKIARKGLEMKEMTEESQTTMGPSDYNALAQRNNSMVAGLGSLAAELGTTEVIKGVGSIGALVAGGVGYAKMTNEDTAAETIGETATDGDYDYKLVDCADETCAEFLPDA